jgi:GABA permease
MAVLASTVFGFLTVIANYLVPDDLFKFLLSTSGAIALLVYLVIAVSPLRMRAQHERAGVHLELKMWYFPWHTRAAIILICGVLVGTLVRSDQRIEVAATGSLALAVLAASPMNRSFRKRRALPVHSRATAGSR